MVYVGKRETVEEINFMGSAHFISFTKQAETSMVTAGDDGRKILPAGSIFPANDETAEGITINPVDVTDGPQPVGVIVEGYVIAERLPVEPSEEAKTSMKEIKYR
ncbi:hypothetical protein [Carnobacterium antarcticum]|uniref:Uncharacterized protein n=1 Tax=Carnobacterium antarcticum TaxID=2126436 RepID=A0ABW4NML8_9LACT|nr:hypothetical protein [Carnobacterium sp. CP1]ALV20754.1 hypothetical protein NY10_129 [Carnobacterium sp. CP1]